MIISFRVEAKKRKLSNTSKLKFIVFKINREYLILIFQVFNRELGKYIIYLKKI